MSEFIELNGGALPFFLLLLVCFNIVLTGAYNLLEVLKDKTASQVDNKIYAIIGAVVPWIQKAIEFAGYNPKH